jgi:hypothetical protein
MHLLHFVPRACPETQSKLAALHPFFEYHAQHNGLWPIIQIHRVWKKLDALMVARLKKREAMIWRAPCSAVYDTFTHLLRDVHHSFCQYAAKFGDMRHKQMQYPPEEKHMCVQEFLQTAQSYSLESRAESNYGEKWLQALRQLDFRLLDTYAFDVMSLHSSIVCSLPVRAFHEASKYRKVFRREFVEPSPHSPHRGAQLQYTLTCMREELRQGRREILTRLRLLEAFFVAPLQRLVEELDDKSLVPTTWAHPCASLIGGSANTVLPHAVINTLTQDLVDTAEKVPTLREYGALGDRRPGKWSHVERIIHAMQRLLVQHVAPTFAASLGRTLEQCVIPVQPVHKLYALITTQSLTELHWLTREEPVAHGIQLRPLGATLHPFNWTGLMLSRYMPRQRRSSPLCLLLVDDGQWVCVKLDVFKEELLEDVLVAERCMKTAVDRHLELLSTHGKMTNAEKAATAAVFRHLQTNLHE